MTTLPEQSWRTLTWDQGKENAEHVRFRIDTGIPVYFCDPPSPWQRPTSENANGLLRSRARRRLAERWSPRHFGDSLRSTGPPGSGRARSRNASRQTARREPSFRLPGRSQQCQLPREHTRRIGCSTVSESVITVSELTRRFGTKTALASVSLSASRGAVYGLVGENGAGKTTLIKHILGLLRAQSGSVRVFGLDPVADPVGVLSRIGYLSEERDLPGWMRVDELMRYSRAFYPAWDDSYAGELRQAFALDASATIGNLSRGQKARVGLLIALAYRPELLVLDEPSTGLDPVVRRDILDAIIRTIADEGRTVLFSSHLLDEVERVADHVTMISHGRIVLSAPLAAIRESHRVGDLVPSLDEIFVAHAAMSAASPPNA